MAIGKLKKFNVYWYCFAASSFLVINDMLGVAGFNAFAMTGKVERSCLQN